MSKAQLAHETIERVKGILDEVREEFPPKFRLSKDEKKSLPKGEASAMETLARVQGIIANATEDNAEEKLINLLSFLRT